MAFGTLGATVPLHCSSCHSEWLCTKQACNLIPRFSHKPLLSPSFQTQLNHANNTEPPTQTCSGFLQRRETDVSAFKIQSGSLGQGEKFMNTQHKSSTEPGFCTCLRPDTLPVAACMLQQSCQRLQAGERTQATADSRDRWFR